MAKQRTEAQWLADPEPQLEFRQSVLRGLSAERKSLECKYFYDERGSALFDEICRQPEYYPTAVETGILERRAAEIAGLIGPGAELVELGSGASLKTRILLRALERPARYLPVDISAEYLQAAAEALAGEFPGLKVRPVIADFTAPFRLPARIAGAPRLLFFPGSTIGNFHPRDAARFLGHTCRELSADALLIGVDLKKDPAVLDAAYNDVAGVTAAFNLNLLERINRELAADFDPGAFEHYAAYVERRGRLGDGRMGRHTPVRHSAGRLAVRLLAELGYCSFSRRSGFQHGFEAPNVTALRPLRSHWRGRDSASRGSW